MKRFLCGWVVLALFLGALGSARCDFIYWTDFSGDIRRANLDGTGEQTLLMGLDTPEGIALDVASGQMYWTDYGSGDIQRANFDGTGQTILVSRLSSPSRIALDLAGGKMYWTDGALFATPGDIRRANLDGSGQEILVTGLATPRGVALDVLGGKMYWANRGSGDIRRANLDGSGQKILASGLNGPLAIALDLPGGKMYWSDRDGGDIRWANLDGSGQETLLTGLANPRDIALDLPGGKMYWLGGITDSDSDIHRANLDGSAQQTLITGLNYSLGIALDLSAPAPLLVTGYSVDVISDKDPSARFAQPFSAGTFAWFESGAVDDNGAPHNDGLPAGLTFVSATAGGATYQIQPANANNVLQLGASQTGTLNLTAPTAYSRLYVLASSGDGTSSSLGSGNLNFADGSTQAFSYNCFDWCNGQGGLHPEAVLTGPNGRADVGANGTAFGYNQDCDFQLYETVIVIDPSHAGVAIASIDFTAPPDAFLSNIFGVSGR